jgi:phage shock protein PspC (stress-responsive transcriptional regulator)
MGTPPPQPERPERPVGPQEPGDLGRSEGRSTKGLGSIRGRMARAGLVRASRGRVLGGVLAGLARRFGVSPWVMRAAFVVSVLLPGPQFLLYAALWIAMPSEP